MKNNLFSLVMALLLVSSAQAQAQSDPVDAIWRTHRVAFYYGSRTTIYSCNSLAEKIGRILRRVGAQSDLQVAATVCDESVGLTRIEIRFRSPVPATQANLLAATSYDTTQLLAARVRGERLPTAEELERFDAEWQTISFARDRKLKLSPGDCDLLQQMLSAVFSRMAIRVETENLWCSQLGNTNRPRLTVIALLKNEPESQ